MRRWLEGLTSDLNEAATKVNAHTETQAQLFALIKERDDPATTPERRAELDSQIEALRERGRAVSQELDGVGDRIDKRLPRWLKLR